MNPPPRSSRPGFSYQVLLSSLLLLVLGPPFLGRTWFGFAIVDVLVVLTVLGGLYATASARVAFSICVVLGVTTLVAESRVGSPPNEAALIVFTSAMTATFLFVAIHVLRDVMSKARTVGSHTIAGALSVYLLIGIASAAGFTLLEFVEPGSFVTAAGTPIEPGDYERFIGFSFTTITTLGYGNISPASSRADALTTAEALAGQFYIALIIARLVALQMTVPPTADPGDRP